MILKWLVTNSQLLERGINTIQGGERMIPLQLDVLLSGRVVEQNRVEYKEQAYLKY